MGLNHEVLAVLRCPTTGERLEWDGQQLVNGSRTRRYEVTRSGIPLFAETFCSAEARIQQKHYDKVARAYIENLTYPHTRAYTKHLDESFLQHIDGHLLGNVAEICCGRGEAFRLLSGRVGVGIGVDVSLSMLEAAQEDFRGGCVSFVQGDATALPIADETFDNVVMFGGIHHVSDRERLFSEIFRILKPGGFFYWREPVSDFFLWRWLRAIIYRFSPALDHETERPLLYKETVPVLTRVGLSLKRWETYGFVGFCIFMNSDVLIFNRFFRFIPGIEGITRAFVRIDQWTLKIPGMSRSGLQVIGSAKKQIGK